MLVDAAGAALGGRIEQPQAFEFVTEEVEPQALVEARGEDVEDRAAHRELAGVDHRVAARIALALEQRSEGFVTDPGARLEQADRFADAERRQHALERGVDGGDQQLRALLAGLQAVERG